MARGIVIRVGGEDSTFTFSKLEREKLYGKKERVVVDENGHTCAPAWLTTDGTALVPLGGTAHVWIDERFAAHDQDERRAVDDEGQPLELARSTLGVAQDAVEVDPGRVLEHATHTVYQLSPETVSNEVREALARGVIYEAPFSFRESYEEDRVFVLANGEGIFALVGRATGFSMLERTQLAPPPDASLDELDDDLDFSMM